MCRVLDLLGRCPRRYTELDGPFFRRAAKRVAEAAARTDGKPSTDATSAAMSGAPPDALGLAAMLSPAFQQPRDAARARLRAQSPDGDYDRWFALRSFPDDTAPLPTGSAATAAAPAIDSARAVVMPVRAG